MEPVAVGRPEGINGEPEYTLLLFARPEPRKVAHWHAEDPVWLISVVGHKTTSVVLSRTISWVGIR